MEQYLNALWLLLSLGLVGAWAILRPRLSDRTSNARALVLEVAILACSVSLLFPAVSMTDDLQYEDNVAVESWRAVEKPVFVKVMVESRPLVASLPQVLDLSPPVSSYFSAPESEQFRASSSSPILIRITRAPPLRVP